MLLYGVVAPYQVDPPQKTVKAFQKCGDRIEELGITHLYIISSFPDAGFNVPLFYLRGDIQKKNIRQILMGSEDFSWYYTLGKENGAELEKDKQPWAIVASATLSGSEAFNKKIQEAFKKRDTASLLTSDRHFVQNLDFDGLKAILFLMGAFSGFNVKTTIRSYQVSKGQSLMISDIKNK